ncbi:MAG: hypothetical protein JRI34_01485, partial [Deltaproteobacteria bacterium]|nr:hypothetical protein [Deltaproteobacteria bacterium]
DVAVGLYFTPIITGRRVGVAGGSGGSSVQAADQCEEAGLDVIPLPQDISEELKNQGSPIWDWIGNPADFSIAMGDNSGTMEILKLMARHPDFDLLIIFVHGPWRRSSEPFSLDKHMEHYNFQGLAQKPLLIVFGDRPRGQGKDAEWYQKTSEQIQERLIEAKLPVYPNVGRAARVANKIVGYYERKPK